MEKNFCIFNFSHLIQFKRFLNLQIAILVLICLSLAVWPYYAFDKISVPVFLTAEVILFISGFLCWKNFKLFFICFIITFISFLIVGELFTRIKYFGWLSFARVFGAVFTVGFQLIAAYLGYTTGGNLILASVIG